MIFHLLCDQRQENCYQKRGFELSSLNGSRIAKVRFDRLDIAVKHGSQRGNVASTFKESKNKEADWSYSM